MTLISWLLPRPRIALADTVLHVALAHLTHCANLEALLAWTCECDYAQGESQGADRKDEAARRFVRLHCSIDAILSTRIGTLSAVHIPDKAYKAAL